MDFSKTIVVYDVKVGRCSSLNKYINLYEYQRSLIFNICNFFSLETARPIKAKFHVQPPWDGERTICSNGPGHIAKMSAMPIYVNMAAMPIYGKKS